MIDSQKSIQKMGFTCIDHPLGNTGHFSWPVRMVKIPLR